MLFKNSVGLHANVFHDDRRISESINNIELVSLYFEELQKITSRKIYRRLFKTLY